MTIAEPEAFAPPSPAPANALDDAALRRIAAGAAPLFERLAGAYQPPEAGNHAARRHLDEW
ncbi:MAG TPA: hypothetical protein VHG93_06910, partial [Longimicrobium sp.]|nr:hypothetical protein [Longimicrobium sp.]